jgi:hypothetical protein
MDTLTIVAIVVIVAVVLLGLAALVWSQKRHSDQLKESFGSEYDYTVGQSGDRREAEKELQQRQQRIERLHIVPLTHDQCTEYTEQWQGVQAHFVDDPRGAIKDADKLVGKVMEKRGYPVGEFEQRAADVSVDHPQVVSNYRLAHNISRASDEGNATTEEMRQAMQSYRSLFDDLLQTAEARR